MSYSGNYEIHTLQELYAKELPELHWVVYDLIPEGLFLLAGESKGGKSVLSANLALSVSKGEIALGRYDVEKGGVLYLDLEGTERRLRDKIDDMVPDKRLPENFFYTVNFPTMDQGGLESLDKWLAENANVKLVIIDTLAKFRGLKKRSSNIYYDDYEVLSQLKNVADKRSIALALIHHTNKLKETKNIFERISGSTGMIGAPDTIGLFLPQEDRIHAKLLIRGRDIDEQNITLRKETEVKAWIAVEGSNEIAISGPRLSILSALKGKHLKPIEIARSINKSNGSVRVLLMKLLEQGSVLKDEAGYYYVPE